MTQDPPRDGHEMPQDQTPRDRDHRVDLGTTAPDRATSHAPDAVRSLKQAMRRARFDDAERLGVLAELRAMQIGRLELLQESLRPLLAQIPRDVDMFDVGIMPGATPRLFIDMIGFVEMGRDARVYRFLQDTRHSRVTIAETAEIPRMVEAITGYVARRLLERDKALAAEAIANGAWSDAPAAGAGQPDATPSSVPAVDPAEVGPSDRAEASPARPPASRGRLRRALQWSVLAFAFIIDLLGATVFFAVLAFGVWLSWKKLRGEI